jgi:hypothetical protein
MQARRQLQVNFSHPFVSAEPHWTIMQELSAKTSLTLVKSLLLAGFACIARDRYAFSA